MSIAFIPSASAFSTVSALDMGFYDDVVTGLSSHRKTLPCKYFYDAAGSALFEEICELEEYYPTRTEMSILTQYLPEMAACIGANARVVEFGSGAGIKTQMLLEALDSPRSYMPIEISHNALMESCMRLSARFPGLALQPRCADYTDGELFERLKPQAPFTVFFPGSTLGNFARAEAAEFLMRMRKLAGFNGGILIGVDRMKDPSILLPAYNDSRGVTAAFNRNLLARINRELGADFDLTAFAHDAIVNWQKECVEMHLVSLKNQTVSIGSRQFRFVEGETIHTEDSHKYSQASFEALAASAGLRVQQSWTDAKEWFSVHYLKAA